MAPTAPSVGGAPRAEWDCYLVGKLNCKFNSDPPLRPTAPGTPRSSPSPSSGEAGHPSLPFRHPSLLFRHPSLNRRRPPPGHHVHRWHQPRRGPGVSVSVARARRLRVRMKLTTTLNSSLCSGCLGSQRLGAAQCCRHARRCWRRWVQCSSCSIRIQNRNRGRHALRGNVWVGLVSPRCYLMPLLPAARASLLPVTPPCDATL